MELNPGTSLFQGGDIHVEDAQQNQEEAEDLEDQKRRQEEIQSLLTKAMHEFNYDDQSTVNSSTNVSVNDSDYDRKYKESSMNDQLKVLYEVRVREVAALTDQVNTLKQELSQQRDSMGKRLMLAEAEEDRAQISLRQSQELLVSKSEQIGKLEKDTENYKKSLQDADNNMRLLLEEKESLKHANNDLSEQLTIMQKGLLANTVSERQLRESRLVKEMKSSHDADMERVLAEYKRKEREYAELEHSYKKMCQEKDELTVEKSETINRLSASLDGAQNQCRELLQLVEVVTHENQKLKRNASNYDLAISLQSGLTDKTEIIKVLQKELEKATDLQNKRLVEFEKLQQTYAELKRDYEVVLMNLDHFKGENNALSHTNQLLENRIKAHGDEVFKLRDELDKFCNVQTENDILQKRINSLQVIINSIQNKETREHSVQVSQIMSSFCEQDNLNKEEIERLETQLRESRDELKTVQTRLSEYEDEISTLKTKVSLEKEREELIHSLQQKAAQFQKIILERQEEPKSIVNVAVNTEKSSNDLEVMKTQYETQLVMIETKLRLAIEAEFEAKVATRKQNPCTDCQKNRDVFKQAEEKQQRKMAEYEQVIKSLVERGPEKCTKCTKMQQELENCAKSMYSQGVYIDGLKRQQLQDRETIVKILEEWKSKFLDLESKNRDLLVELEETRKVRAETEAKLVIRENGDAKLVEDLQMETMNLIKQWNQKAIDNIHKLTAAQRDKLLDSRQKIDRICKKTDKKVKEIELNYKKSCTAFEKSPR